MVSPTFLKVFLDKVLKFVVKYIKYWKYKICLIKDGSNDAERHFWCLVQSFLMLRAVISDTQISHFWCSEQSFLMLRAVISDAQSSHFWYSDQSFLMLRAVISKAQNSHFWCSEQSFLMLRAIISDSQSSYFWCSEQSSLMLRAVFSEKVWEWPRWVLTDILAGIATLSTEKGSLVEWSVLKQSSTE